MPKKKSKFTVLNEHISRTLELEGRVAWALNALREAGERGVKPLEHPAPRWSAYVATLRALGIEIDTVREKHGGDFPGHHGRYVLRSKVMKG